MKKFSDKPLFVKTPPRGARRIECIEDGNEKNTQWVYYPWNNSAVRIPQRSVFTRVRTSRNLDLITAREQKKLRKTPIAIAGLNVGNPAALCLALEGAEEMRFADNDILTLSNLNRFRARLSDLGVNKAVLSARQVYDINPFANLRVYPDGIRPNAIDAFLTKPKVSLLIEVMDALPLKILIRQRARALRIPVIMVTGNGPNVILDIERFDRTSSLPLLNGYLRKSVVNKIIHADPQKLTAYQKAALAKEFMGPKLSLVPRLKASFLKVGRTLPSIPQLAEASFLRGAVLTAVTRSIIFGKRSPSGRYHVRLDTLFR